MTWSSGPSLIFFHICPLSSRWLVVSRTLNIAEQKKSICSRFDYGPCYRGGAPVAGTYSRLLWQNVAEKPPVTGPCNQRSCARRPANPIYQKFSPISVKKQFPTTYGIRYFLTFSRLCTRGNQTT